MTNSNNTFNKKNQYYYTKKSNEIIPKYNYDKYVFNKKLKTKRDILDHQYQKEIIFQKNLLRSKHDENNNEPIFFDIKKIRDDAEEFYKLRLDDEIQKAKERALKKEEQSKKKTNYINHTNAEDFLKNLKIFPKLVKTAVSLNERKESPNTVNKKILEKLDGDIDNIEVIKGYLINAQKRKEKKNKNGNI
jgi:heterodisulfide reductase subunit A-like polyferredoxin